MWSLCLCLVVACGDDASNHPKKEAAADSDASSSSASDAGKRADAGSARPSSDDAAVTAESNMASGGSGSASSPSSSAPQGPRYRSDVTPVTNVADAMKGVFIPPYDDCRAPKDGEPEGMSAGGKVCTHVMISGCTEPGRYFPDYASCSVVRTQRPFWEEAPANIPREDDPRLQDPEFMKELAWMTEQVSAAACTCCHDSRAEDGKVGQWDINRGPIWLDTLSDTGLALFVGLADSSALGAYPAAENHGFDRDKTGIPTTDTARMQAFLRKEMERRGITEEQARAVPPFGGPIYANRTMKPVACAGQGVDAQSQVQLGDAQVRYVYVLDEKADNPGVPPNQDLPEGTRWRIDVLPSEAALKGPFAYGATPAGSFQALPADKPAPALEKGKVYRLYALKDVGLPVINCTFTFGEDLGQAPAKPAQTPTTPTTPSTPAPDAGMSAGGTCDAQAAFGASCTDSKNHSDCPCAPASYCAQMPGQAAGYCTARGCKENPSVCPSGWSCFDLSAFSPDLPAICMKP